MSSRRRHWLASIVIGGTSQAAIVHVPGDHATIQDAIDAAGTGDVVVVHPGVYQETLSISVKGVTIRSIDPGDSVIVATTVVDGSGLGSVVTFAATDSTTMVSGLTLTGGSGTPWCLDGGTCGGGIYCGAGASPRLDRCVVRDNSTVGPRSEGAGVYCIESSSPTFVDCTITGNEIVVGGEGEGYGGGVYCNDSDPVFVACEISENMVPEQYPRFGVGGGLHCVASSPVLEFCTVAGNEAAVGGGMAFQGAGGARIENCIIRDNRSTHESAAAEGWNSGEVFRNCVIAYNSAGWGGAYGCQGGTLTHCILWGNEPAQVSPWISASLSYCDVEGGWNGKGNIDADPLFRTRLGFDLLLASGSPCIDAGDPAREDGVFDGHPRWPGWYSNGARADMGAYGGPRNAGWLGRD